MVEGDLFRHGGSECRARFRFLLIKRKESGGDLFQAGTVFLDGRGAFLEGVQLLALRREALMGVALLRLEAKNGLGGFLRRLKLLLRLRQFACHLRGGRGIIHPPVVGAQLLERCISVVQFLEAAFGIKAVVGDPLVFFLREVKRAVGAWLTGVGDKLGEFVLHIPHYAPRPFTANESADFLRDHVIENACGALGGFRRIDRMSLLHPEHAIGGFIEGARRLVRNAENFPHLLVCFCVACGDHAIACEARGLGLQERLGDFVNPAALLEANRDGDRQREAFSGQRHDLLAGTAVALEQAGTDGAEEGRLAGLVARREDIDARS